MSKKAVERLLAKRLVRTMVAISSAEITAMREVNAKLRARLVEMVAASRARA
jgi:hypothetical protein